MALLFNIIIILWIIGLYWLIYEKEKEIKDCDEKYKNLFKKITEAKYVEVVESSWKEIFIMGKCKFYETKNGIAFTQIKDEEER